MTTDNIVPVTRDLEVLLRMDSYQDMTDEEINMIINFKVETAVSERDTSELVKIVQDTSNTLVEMANNRYEEGMKKFKELTSRRKIYEEVPNE